MPYKNSSLTRDEQRAQMSLWAIVKSPLMFGGDATRLDAWTHELLSNRDVLEMNAHSRHNRQVHLDNASAVWTARNPVSETVYAAIFNRRNETAELMTSCVSLGLDCTATSYAAVDLWGAPTRPRVSHRHMIKVTVAAHGVAMLGIDENP